MPTLTIQTKRVYDSAAEDDGLRVLVDRVWPRGISKDKAKLDRWIKDIAPSTELRKWFNHEPAKWSEFKKRYHAELREHKDVLYELLDEAQQNKTLTLVYSAKDEQHNNAVALREYLNRLKR